MNPIQNKDQIRFSSKIDFSLIEVGKAKTASVWQRLKNAFASSDLDFQTWQHLESKKFVRRDFSKYGGNH